MCCSRAVDSGQNSLVDTETCVVCCSRAVDSGQKSLVDIETRVMCCSRAVGSGQNSPVDLRHVLCAVVMQWTVDRTVPWTLES